MARDRRKAIVKLSKLGTRVSEHFLRRRRTRDKPAGEVGHTKDIRWLVSPA